MKVIERFRKTRATMMAATVSGWLVGEVAPLLQLYA